MQFPTEDQLIIGFIGGGNMAKAIGFSVLSKGILKPDQICVSAPSDRNLKEWKEKGCRVFNDNSKLLEASNIIFLATKPQNFEKAVSVFRTADIRDINLKCFVSIMAGLSVNHIKKIIYNQFREFCNEDDIDVVRVMPNTPILIGHGTTAIADNPRSPWMEIVKKLMSAGGSCEVMDEKILNAAGAVSGCGPAYMYMIIEALADGAVKCGVPRDIAMRMAANTMVGGAKMVLTGEHPGSLKDKVCSAGGSTIAAIHTLEKSGVRGAFMSAVEAAHERAKQLGN